MVGADFAIAVQHHIAVARESRPAVVEQYGILPIAQHSYFGHCGQTVEISCVTFGLHFRVLVTFILSHLQINVRSHLCFFFQQGLHRTHGRLLHKVVLQAVIAQIVGQAGQYHALMVGIVGADRHMVLLVIALEQSHTAVIHLQILEPLQIVVHCIVVHAYCHQRAVWRNYNAVRCGVLELQIRHTEGVVLVVLCVVQLVIGRFRYAPRQF